MNLTDTDIKAAIISMFEEWKETTFKEVKENMVNLTQKIGNLNRYWIYKKESNRNSRF